MWRLRSQSHAAVNISNLFLYVSLIIEFILAENASDVSEMLCSDWIYYTFDYTENTTGMNRLNNSVCFLSLVTSCPVPWITFS